MMYKTANNIAGIFVTPAMRLLVMLFVVAATEWGSGTARGSCYDIVRQANKLYHDKQYSKAIELYQQAESAAGDKAEPVLLYNRANCYYKLGNYTEAINLYEKVSALGQGRQLGARAKFNLGNCYYHQAQRQEKATVREKLDLLRQSVRYYREALDMNPTDKDARYNIALVRRTMQQLQAQLKQQQKQQQKQQKQLPDKIRELLDRQIKLLQQATPPGEGNSGALISQAKNILRLILPRTFAKQQTGRDEALLQKLGTEGMKGLAKKQQQLQTDTTAVKREADQQLQQLTARQPNSTQPSNRIHTQPGQQPVTPPVPPDSYPQQQPSAPPGPQPSQQAPGSSPGQTAAIQKILETVTRELANSEGYQTVAVQSLERSKLSSARKNQLESARALKRALDAFPKQKPSQQNKKQNRRQNQRQQENQQGQKQQQSQQKKQTQQSKQQKQKQQNKSQQKQPQQSKNQKEQKIQARKTDSSDKIIKEILQKEQQRLEQRRLRIIRTRGQGVEKDW